LYVVVANTIKEEEATFMWQYNPTKLNSSGIKTESFPFSASLSTITRPADSLGGDRTDYSTGAPVAVESSAVT